MFVLRNTTSTLQMQAGSDPGADVPIYISFSETIDAQQVGKQVSAGDQNLQYQTSKLANGGTTAVTVLSAPASGYRRRMQGLLMKNTGAGSVAYSFRFIDSAATVTTVTLTFTLVTGDILQYQDGKGFWVTDSAGYVK